MFILIWLSKHLIKAAHNLLTMCLHFCCGFRRTHLQLAVGRRDHQADLHGGPQELLALGAEVRGQGARRRNRRLFVRRLLRRRNAGQEWIQTPHQTGRIELATRATTFVATPARWRRCRGGSTLWCLLLLVVQQPGG